MNTNEKLSLLKRYIHACNSFKIETMCSLLHDEILVKNFVDGEHQKNIDGIEAFEKVAQEEKKLYSSRKYTILEHQEFGEKVTLEMSYSAVLAKDVESGKVAGDGISRRGLVEVRFKEKKIYRLTWIL